MGEWIATSNYNKVNKSNLCIASNVGISDKMLKPLTNLIEDIIDTRKTLTYNKWEILDKERIKEVAFMNTYKSAQFIESIKQESDFVKAYVFGNEYENAWVIINEASLENELKYMRLYREFNCDAFSILLFEEDEEEDILEQLKYSDTGYEGYKVYGK